MLAPRMTTTTSRPVRIDWCVLKLSRIRRLRRLRSTARLSFFFDTAKPSLAWSDPFKRANRRKFLSTNRLPSLKTRRKSSGFSNRFCWGNPLLPGPKESCKSMQVEHDPWLAAPWLPCGHFESPYVRETRECELSSDYLVEMFFSWHLPSFIPFRNQIEYGQKKRRNIALNRLICQI